MNKLRINNGETGLQVRTKLNSNFTELYDNIDNKVDIVVGKQLSDENFEFIEKSKLASIDVGNRLTVTFAEKDQIANISKKVDMVIGKDLSTNDYTTIEKDKLASLNNYILPTSNVSTLGGVKSGLVLLVDVDGNVTVADNSHQHTITNVTGLESILDSKVDNDKVYDKITTDNKIGSIVAGLAWKQNVATFADLSIKYPTPTSGWVASVDSDGKIYRYNGTVWESIMIQITPVASNSVNGLLSSNDFTKLQSVSNGATKVEISTINGGIKINGVEKLIYTHPVTHSADMIIDGVTNKIFTSTEKTKLNGLNNFSGKASDVIIDATGFNRNLTINETTVQKLATKVDQLIVASSGLGAVNIDDTKINTVSTYSSDKIEKNRISKLEQMLDVDIVGKKNNQVLSYSDVDKKWIAKSLLPIGGITNPTMNQVSKMGIVATAGSIRTINIPINTVDFNFPRINVLKYEVGTQNTIVTKNTFNNGESNDFKADDAFVFDGKAHMRTEYIQDYILSRSETTFKEYKTTIDLNKYKLMGGFEDFEDRLIQRLKVKAVPFDRILVPQGDMNLSNMEHLDYFKLTTTGNNLKVVCSVDSGVTWKTFKTDKWADINLVVDDIKANGIDIIAFNKINDTFWNELITTNKIRFAYLFSMDNIADVEELDSLDLQFDGRGKWIQAMETEYTVTYTSNTLLQVDIKFSGDIKINY